MVGQQHELLLLLAVLVQQLSQRHKQTVLQMCVVRLVRFVRIAQGFVLDSMEMMLLVLEMVHGSPSSLDSAMT